MTDRKVIKEFFELVEKRCAQCRFKNDDMFKTCKERCFYFAIRNYPLLLEKKSSDFWASLLPNENANRGLYPAI